MHVTTQVTGFHPAHRPSTRYGDPQVIRSLARSMRAQGQQIEEESDRLSRKAAATPWSGLAADAMRGSVSMATTSLRRTAELHFVAAVALEQHADEVERVQRLIDRIEHGVLSRVRDARQRLAGLAGAVGAAEDELMAHFDPPPSGHKDWLTTHLPLAIPGLAPSDLAGAVLR